MITDLFFVTDKPRLHDSKSLLHYLFPQLRVEGALLSEHAGQLEQDLPADNDIVLEDGVEDGAHIGGDCGGIWGSKDIVHGCNVRRTLVLLRERRYLRKSGFHSEGNIGLWRRAAK